MSEPKQEERYYLEWRNVDVFAGPKQILYDQSGRVSSGELIGILGASGSGKTTLLNYLSGFIDPVMKAEGTVGLGDGGRLTGRQMRGLCGYVLQEDILQTQLTVRENIYYSAKFKLKCSEEEISQRIDAIIKALNLEKCKDQRIGTEFQRGVSGGERKRTCIGMELVHQSSILFLDEPTTGLDSVNAEDIVSSLKTLAQSNRIIVSTIHQPSAELLKLFDKILVMHEGKKIYFGAFEDMFAFYLQRGVQLPDFIHPVEYLLTCLNMNENNCKLLEEVNPQLSNNFSYERVHRLKEIGEEVSRQVTEPLETFDQAKVRQLVESAYYESPKFGYSLKILAIRSFLVFFRDKKSFIARLWLNLSLFVLTGTLYRHLGLDPQGVQSRQGALYFFMFAGLLPALMSTGFIFTGGVQFLKKELQQGLYTPVSYLLGVTIPPAVPNLLITNLGFSIIYLIAGLNMNNIDKLVNFNVIIGTAVMASEGWGLLTATLFPDTLSASNVIPIIIMPQVLVCGYLTSLANIPKITLPLQWVSVFRYTYNGLMMNEFEDLECEGCASVPADRGLTLSVQECIFWLISLSFLLRLVGMIAFHWVYRRYSKQD